jgi:hypothetical protein
MRIQSRGRRTVGLALTPLVLIGLAGALRAAQPLLAARADARKPPQLARSYHQIGKLLRDGKDNEALAAWVALDDSPLLVPPRGSEDPESLSLEMGLAKAADAMASRSTIWRERCKALAERLEATPGQSETGYELAWRIKRQANA